MRKLFLYATWIVIAILVFSTILSITPIHSIVKYPATLVNFLQRVTGLLLFALLFSQIAIGAFLPRLIDKMGGWVFNFHVWQGKIIYALAVIHPILFIFFNHFTKSVWDPYAAFVNICVLCDQPINYYYSFGIISFWILSFSVLSVFFRNSTPWMRTNWRKLHVLNYVIFILIAVHGFFLGTDFQGEPFFVFAIVAIAVVLGIILFLELPRLYKNYKKWIAD